MGPREHGKRAFEVGATARYLITGGAGFIGSHIADALTARRDQVAILDDFSTGRRANVEHLVASGSIELVEGCVTDSQLVTELMADCDRCLHLASTVGVRLVVSYPLETLQRIVRGADVVISAGAAHGKRVLFASTSEVYGKSSNGLLSEDSDRVLGSIQKSRWSYAIAKAYGEAIAFGYHREYGADTMVARLFNTIGPRQIGTHGMVVPRLVRQAIAGEDLTVFGDGEQARCFMHVQDATAALIALVDDDGANGGVFNIGSQNSITIQQLAVRIIERVGSRSRITRVPYAQAYDDGFEELGRRTPDTTALQKLTGWRPRHSLDDALDDVIAFQRAKLALEAEARLVAPRNGARADLGVRASG